MEGLEAVEINFVNALICDNLTFRFDSEYFQKFILMDIEKLKKIKSNSINEIASVKGGKRLPLGHNFVNLGIPYIRAEDVKNSFVQYKNSPFISKETHNEIFSYQTFKNDVLLTIVGNSIGDIGIVKFDLEKCNLTENCIKIIPTLEQGKFFSDYLFLFLKSQFGQLQIQREKVGTAQPKLAIERIRSFLVPTVSIVFQERCSLLMQQGEACLLSSEVIYLEAEYLLLQALSCNNHTEFKETINIKSFKDSFASTGRLDAEYYQPKYEQLVAQIVAQPHAKLTDLVVFHKSIEPGSEAYSDDGEGLPFVRVADYSKFGLSKPQKRLSTAYVADNQTQLEGLKPKKDMILFSKDGSVGEALCLRENADFVTSGAILHLTVKDKSKVIPEYLTLALNSVLVKTQAERDAGGSIILHWRPEEIKNVLVPLLNLAQQQEIAALVQESFTLKTESERLLEVAKRAVEIAVEQDEAAGLAYIAAQMAEAI